MCPLAELCSKFNDAPRICGTMGQFQRCHMDNRRSQWKSITCTLRYVVLLCIRLLQLVEDDSLDMAHLRLIDMAHLSLIDMAYLTLICSSMIFVLQHQIFKIDFMGSCGLMNRMERKNNLGEKHKCICWIKNMCWVLPPSMIVHKPEEDVNTKLFTSIDCGSYFDVLYEFIFAY